MKLYIDCEFNGFGGELISMALVSESGHEWYEVLPCEQPVDWVAEHVMPILNKEALQRREDLVESLGLFLSQFDRVHIVADWPEDIAYFCNSLILSAGLRINTPPITLEILRIDGAESLVPHNALHDARSIKEFLNGE